MMARFHAFMRDDEDNRVSAFASNDRPGRVVVASSGAAADPEQWAYVTPENIRAFALDLLRAADEADGLIS